MKAYKIDATNNVITTVELTENYRDITNAIGCELFCVGHTLKNGDTLFVDDEGWLNAKVKRVFKFDGRLFAGNGLIVGLNRNNGNSVSVKTKELDIAKLVEFASKGFEITDEMRDNAMGSWTITTF